MNAPLIRTRTGTVELSGRRPSVFQGMPVTLTLWSDTHAAVVTRVTAKTVTIARVETGPVRPDMASDEGAYGLRPTLADGILSSPIPGTETRFTFRNGAWRNGSTRAILGHSVTRIDWRD